MSFVDEINEIIINASKYGGYVFSEYVQNVLVALEMGMDISISDDTTVPTDIDFWFSSQESVDAFIKSLPDFVTINPSSSPDQIEFSYEKDERIVRFRILISELFTINDIDINLLLCQLTTGEEGLEYIWHSTWVDFPVENLKNSIQRKEIRLLPEMVSFLLTESRDFQLNEQILNHINRLKFMYANRGWKIVHRNQMCTPDKLIGISTFQGWLKRANISILSSTPGLTIPSIPSSSGPVIPRQKPPEQFPGKSAEDRLPSVRLVSRSRETSLEPGAKGILSAAAKANYERIKQSLGLQNISNYQPQPEDEKYPSQPEDQKYPSQPEDEYGLPLEKEDEEFNHHPRTDEEFNHHPRTDEEFNHHPRIENKYRPRNMFKRYLRAAHRTKMMHQGLSDDTFDASEPRDVSFNSSPPSKFETFDPFDSEPVPSEYEPSEFEPFDLSSEA